MIDATSFWSRVKKGPGCWEWAAGRFHRGYGSVWVDGKARKAHRVSFELSRGPIPHNLKVLHRCDNPPCVNPDHLFLGTDADNAADRDAKGRAGVLRGESHGRAAITTEQATEVRDLWLFGACGKALAERFGISRSCVERIATGKSWAHLPPCPDIPVLS